MRAACFRRTSASGCTSCGRRLRAVATGTAAAQAASTSSGRTASGERRGDRDSRAGDSVQLGQGEVAGCPHAGRACARTRGSRRSSARTCWRAACRPTWPGRSSCKPHDVAEHSQQQALMWSKILPFVLFIWALTGAFYPAVDLCAGEKERGTLETLLSSPALRTEIVWGKLLTVMTFSAATAAVEPGEPGLHGPLRHLAVADDADGGRLAKVWICRRSRRRCGWWWRWCRCRRCSARCAWRARRSPAAPRKASTT